MRFLILSLLLLQPLVWAEDAFEKMGVEGSRPISSDFNCIESQTETPPFFVSDEYKQGDRMWENLRDIEDHRANKYYLPRGAVVHSPRELVESLDAVRDKVPVKVLSLPKKSTEDHLRGVNGNYDETGARQRKRFKRVTSGTEGRKRAEKGVVGYIHAGALRPSGDFTFVVQEDSPVFASPAFSNLNDKLINPKMDAGKFVMDRCCTKDTFPGPETCFDKYQFEVRDKEQKLLGVLKGDVAECNIFQHIMPIANKELDIMLSFFEGVDKAYPGRGLGLIDQLPANQYWVNRNRARTLRPNLVNIPVDPKDGQGPYNSYHYKRDDKYSSDAFMTPTTACAFTEVLRKWNDECKGDGCEVQFGDSYHHDSWGVHSSHDSGECIDIRPFRKDDDDDAGLTFKYSRYSRDRTNNFIKLLKKAGASYIIFNDPKIKEWVNKDKSSSVHDDHLHICLRARDEKVKKACTEGIE